MSISSVIFYLISAMILVCGFLAVTSGKIFRAAIYLLFSLIGIAGLFFFLENDFIAAVQIVVYVGGIVVLIIFSIFLTSSGKEKVNPHRFKRILTAAILSLSGLLFSIWVVFTHVYIPAGITPDRKSVV